LVVGLVGMILNDTNDGSLTIAAASPKNSWQRLYPDRDSYPIADGDP
jgi:hypothetical protein